MFSIGQQLYELTDKDQQTLFVDPFFRTVSVTIPALSNNGDAIFNLPLDRALWISSLIIRFDNASVSTWHSAQAYVTNTVGNRFQIFDSAGNATSILNGDYQNGGVGTSFSINRQLDLLIPPQTSSLIVGTSRTGNTNPVNFVAYVAGYLLPPGRVGRLA